MATIKNLFAFLALGILLFTSCTLSKNAYSSASFDKMQIAQEGNTRYHAAKPNDTLSPAENTLAHNIVENKPIAKNKSHDFKPVLLKAKTGFKKITNAGIVKVWKPGRIEKGADIQRGKFLAWGILCIIGGFVFGFLAFVCALASGLGGDPGAIIPAVIFAIISLLLFILALIYFIRTIFNI